jgi:adenosylmethionine-8-amino-7-oxononanoate aminotransferase
MHRLASLDQSFVWHPFTQMRDWLTDKPTVIMSGRGTVLKDINGRRYLDGNSSIWTNLHGHNHPAINAAIRRQLKAIAHSSALGLANEPSALLASRLIALSKPPGPVRTRPQKGRTLAKVFFSDDGSTAIEVALKLAYEFARRSGMAQRPRFLSLEGAYHGDTIGAMALGHSGLFKRPWSGLTFKTDKVMAPYCYRCPHNRAKPEKGDARDYRKCNWECLDKLEQKCGAQARTGSPYAGFVVEPLIQGAAGMIPQPEGWLRRASEIVRGYKTPLIADEVMTAFGRTGSQVTGPAEDGGKSWNPLFACQIAGVQPDFLALAKGLTGGYLPMAATLTTQAVFDAFLGRHGEFKTFFHGHSYSGNQLGSAAALASLDLLESPASLRDRTELGQNLAQELDSLKVLPNVGDVRQVGLVAGIELVKNRQRRERLNPLARSGSRICQAMARRGVLTRPIGDVIVLMPPYCTTGAQVGKMVAALREGIIEILGVTKD